MLIRFSGLDTALNEWREAVAKRVGKVVGPTFSKENKYGVRYYAECELTQADREALMADWHGNRPSDGMPWNHCITYQEVKK